jgi:hypothetical protein
MVAAIAEQLLGVGQDPDALALMRRTGVACPHDSPSRIVPHRGQVAENASKPPRSEHWGVLHEHVSRSYLANDAGHLRPESGAGVIKTCSLSRRADSLAGKAARKHVNAASPWSAIKGAHVIPDGKRRQCAVVLSRDKNACGVGIALNGADGSPSEKEAAEDASAGSGEDGKLSQAAIMTLLISQLIQHQPSTYQHASTAEAASHRGPAGEAPSSDGCNRCAAQKMQQLTITYIIDGHADSSPANAYLCE